MFPSGVKYVYPDSFAPGFRLDVDFLPLCEKVIMNYLSTKDSLKN